MKRASDGSPTVQSSTMNDHCDNAQASKSIGHACISCHVKAHGLGLNCTISQKLVPQAITKWILALVGKSPHLNAIDQDGLITSCCKYVCRLALGSCWLLDFSIKDL